MIITALLLLLVIVKAQCEHFQEKPILSADQADGVYVFGEVITFTCKTTKSLDSYGSFLLYKDGERVSTEPIYNSERNNATFITQAILSGLKEHNYSYTCNVFQRNVESSKSTTVLIKVLDAPEKPRLLLDRADKVYVSDELITLNCTAANSPDPVLQYLFYEVTEQTAVNHQYYPWQRSSTYTIRNTTTGRKGYHCAYAIKMLGRIVHSRESEKEEISVVYAPEKPLLLPDRADKVYVSDELITLNCTPANGPAPISDYLFYEVTEQTQVNYQYYPWQSSATYTIRNTTTGRKGYHCAYAIGISGRNVRSEESDRVQITVVDLPSPSLSLASGYVAQGENVTFNCTSTKNISVGTFYLYKNGVRLNDSVLQSTDAENKSATFTIQNVDPGNSASYICAYQLLEGDRYLTSAPSESVLLCVSVESNQRWIPALAVVAPAFLFVILGIYCWKKKGKTKRRRELSDGTRWTPSTNQARRKDRHEHLKSPRPNESASRTFVPTTIDGPNDNIVYVDLKVIQPAKKPKGTKKRFEAHGENRNIYADLKL